MFIAENNLFSPIAERTADRPDAETWSSHRQRLALLSQAVDELPTRCRAIFLMHKIDGLGQVEIAGRLGIPCGQVETQVMRALAHCRKRADTVSGGQPAVGIEDQALAWFVRLHAGDEPAVDRRGFQQWLAADPCPAAAYDRYLQTWQDLDRLPDPRRRARSAGLPSRRALLAGGLALAGLAGLHLAAPSGIFRTAPGERRTVTLADGSRIDLDGESTLIDDAGPRLRRVKMTAGRARFTVVPDPDRPFEVVCGPGRLRSREACFVLHRRAERIDLAVLSGAVDLRAGKDERQSLTGGWRLSYDAAGLGGAEAAAAAAETAWLNGRLIFEETPLAAVIEDLNRYRRGRILLGDPALADLRVTAVIEAGDPAGALAALTRSLPLRSRILSPYLVVLQRV